jgi:hypothetical protein
VTGIGQVEDNVVMYPFLDLVEEVLESVWEKLAIEPVDYVIQNELEEVLRRGNAKVAVKL